MFSDFQIFDPAKGFINDLKVYTKTYKIIFLMEGMRT